MTVPDHDPALEDILDAYSAENGALSPPSHAVLAAWTRRYPRYARELAEFSAHWSLMQWLPSSPATAAIDEAELVQRGMRVAVEALRAAGLADPQGIQPPMSAPRAEVVQPPIASLLDEGRVRGLAISALAERAELSVPLLLKLERRLLRAATVPARVVERVAQVIERDAAAVAAYLQGAPHLAQSASYHAPQAPTLAEQEDFAEAVRRDLTLTEQQRAALLALEPPAGDVE